MSSKTYQIHNDNNINMCLDYNKDDYDLNSISKDKDMLISQLKAKIFELELHQKDYDMLNERYAQLQNEFSSLNDIKLQLECEKKMQDEELNSHISELQSENENLLTLPNVPLPNVFDIT